MNISKESMRRYFQAVNRRYKLDTAEGIRRNIQARLSTDALAKL